MTKLPGIDSLTILIAKESMLPWGMAERIAEAIIRAGYRREQTAPEPATSGENISPPKAAEIDTELLDWKY
jgi:hypothetical protein